MEYKEVLTSISLCTHQVFNYSKWTKNDEDMGLKLERVYSYFFKKIETNYHSSSSCVLYVAPLLLTFK
jgi:hypothetical protein